MAGAYHKITSRRGNFQFAGPANPTPTFIQGMESQGRRPFYDNRGNFGGFASRPGAPQATGDTQAGLGIAGPVGSAQHTSTWDQFFGKNVPPSVPVTPSANPDISADESFGGGSAPVASASPLVTAGDHVGAAIANNSSWLSQNGVTVPPPPSPRMAEPLIPTATNQMTFSSSYAPSDTQQSTSPVLTKPSSWVTTGPDQLAAIRQRYASNG